jgi:hypothetical protein
MPRVYKYGVALMTNEELQNVINKGDICITDSDGILRRFVGFAKCEWLSTEDALSHIYYSACLKCKGRMIFEDVSSKQRKVRCHSHTSKGGNHTDVEIIYPIGDLLGKELFEI